MSKSSNQPNKKAAGKQQAKASPEAPERQAAEAETLEEPLEERASGDEELWNELAEAREEIERLKDKLLRAHAEMDNLRKRTERQVEEARKYAIEKFALALLDVVDNLERALAVEEGNEAALREGLKMTLDAWHAVMRKFEMERIDAVGQPFDPHHHEALSHMPSEEHPEGVVAAQHVAGYKLSGRLLRPARVLVSSGAPGGGDEREQKENEAPPESDKA